MILYYALELGKLKKVYLKPQKSAIALLEYQKDKGWYYTDPDWRLPSISLSQGELFALTLGARMLEAYAGSAYLEELRSAIARFS